MHDCNQNPHPGLNRCTGCQGRTKKYLTQGNPYHPRHTIITRDIVEGNTGVSRVIQGDTSPEAKICV